MDKKMRIINLQFEQFRITNSLLNSTSNQNEKNDQEGCSRFCYQALQVINKTEMRKMDALKDYLADNHLIHMIKLFQLCSDREKQNGKDFGHSQKFHDEIYRKNKQITECEEMVSKLKEIVASQTAELERKETKVRELEQSITALARMGRRRALEELNEYGQRLLKSFKIDSVGIETPEELQFRNGRTLPLTIKKRNMPLKKFFITDGLRKVKKMNESEGSLMIKQIPGSELGIRLSKTHNTARNSGFYSKKKKQVKPDEEIVKLEAEKENYLSHMSEKIVLFQKKMATIQKQIECKKNNLPLGSSSKHV